jgi:hypothetical protein
MRAVAAHAAGGPQSQAAAAAPVEAFWISAILSRLMCGIIGTVFQALRLDNALVGQIV